MITKKSSKSKKLECERCFAVFDTQTDLDTHKLYLHGEVSDEEHRNAKDTPTHKIYKYTYIDKKPPKHRYIIPPKSEWVLFGGNLKSRDGVYVGYYYIWNNRSKKYEMRTSWGSLIEYYKPIKSFCPVDVYKVYKNKSKTVSNDVLKELVKE